MIRVLIGFGKGILVLVAVGLLARTGATQTVDGVTDCRVSRVSDDTLVVASCNVRVGTKGWTFPETRIVLNPASPADTIRVFVQNGSLVAGYMNSSTMLSGGGFVPQEGIAEFPAESLPIAVWGAKAVPGRWDSSGVDARVLLQASIITPGVGLAASDNPTTGIRVLSVDTATTPQFAAGTTDPIGNCRIGQRWVRTDTNKEWVCTSLPAGWILVTGGGASGSDRIYSTYPAATCQPSAAQPGVALPSTSFAMPSSNAPTPACVTGFSAGDSSTASSAWTFGTLSFAENTTAATAQSIQHTIVLPPGWTSRAGVDMDVKWRTSATSGNVVWQVQGQCVGDGETPGNFSAPVAFTADTAKGTTLQFNDTATRNLTTADVLAGCAERKWFLLRFFRDATHPSDTLGAAAELVNLRFRVTYTPQ